MRRVLDIGWRLKQSSAVLIDELLSCIAHITPWFMYIDVWYTHNNATIICEHSPQDYTLSVHVGLYIIMYMYMNVWRRVNVIYRGSPMICSYKYHYYYCLLFRTEGKTSHMSVCTCWLEWQFQTSHLRRIMGLNEVYWPEHLTESSEQILG